MQDLETLLQEHFGPRRGTGRMVALGEAHALHDAGYEVVLSRYAVGYRDAARALDFPAEFDDDGELVIHPAVELDATLRARLAQALEFLAVDARFE